MTYIPYTDQGTAYNNPQFNFHIEKNETYFLYLRTSTGTSAQPANKTTFDGVQQPDIGTFETENAKYNILYAVHTHAGLSGETYVLEIKSKKDVDITISSAVGTKGVTFTYFGWKIK